MLELLSIPGAVLQPGVNGFALQCQHTKNTLMNSAEGFFVYESLECFQP